MLMQHFQIDAGRVPRNHVTDVQDENPAASRIEFVNRMLSEREILSSKRKIA